MLFVQATVHATNRLHKQLRTQCEYFLLLFFLFSLYQVVWYDDVVVLFIFYIIILLLLYYYTNQGTVLYCNNGRPLLIIDDYHNLVFPSPCCSLFL